MIDNQTLTQFWAEGSLWATGSREAKRSLEPTNRLAVVRLLITFSNTQIYLTLVVSPANLIQNGVDQGSQSKYR